MLWAPEDSGLRLDISLQTLWDDRTPDLGSPYYTGNFAYDQPRLPSGSIEISWKSGTPITIAEGSVSLHSAVASLNVTTAAGGFEIQVWASAAWDKMGGDVVVLEVTSSGGEEARAVWLPAVAASTWAKLNPLKTYVPNPASSTTTTTPMSGVYLNVTTQPHLPQKGTGHSSAVLSFADGPKQYHIVCLSNTKPSPATADDIVKAQVIAAYGSLTSIRQDHEAWWANWWPAGGFVTLEHTPLESFWWIQLYKFASGTALTLSHSHSHPLQSFSGS